jgi:hypothetical protein
MKNVLWRIINKSSELTCIRRLILLIFNELNLTKRSYENDYCFVWFFFREIHVSHKNIQTIAFQKIQSDNIISCA